MSTKKDHRIALQSAIEMTTRFRANQPPGFARAEALDKDAVMKLLQTPGCSYLRIYYGMRENMEATAILVAADAKGNDILPTASQLTEEPSEDDVLILDDTIRCPPFCPTSTLNPGDGN